MRMFRTAFEIGRERGYAPFYLMKHRPAPTKPEVCFIFYIKLTGLNEFCL